MKTKIKLIIDSIGITCTISAQPWQLGGNGAPLNAAITLLEHNKISKCDFLQTMHLVCL